MFLTQLNRGRYHRGITAYHQTAKARALGKMREHFIYFIYVDFFNLMSDLDITMK